MTLRQILEVFGTYSRKVGDLGISEDLLARFQSDHEFKSPPTVESFAFQEFGRRKGRLRIGATRIRSVLSETCRLARKSRALNVPAETPSTAEASGPESSS